MRANLRLATKLEDLEDNQETLHPPIRHPQTQETVPAPAGSILPKRHWHVAQLKRDEANWPEWKRLVFWWLYIPLFRFFHKHLRFNTPVQRNADGSYSWVEHQGCYLTEAEAQADAAKYEGGYVVPDLPLGESLPAETVPKSKIFFPGKRETTKPSLAPLIAEAWSEVKLIRATVETAQHKQ